MKRLTPEMIESSAEIQSWLKQFKADHQAGAYNMLLNLIFVSRDEYSQWLIRQLNSLDSSNIYGIYSVCKTDDSIKSLWDANGEIIDRPGEAMGSEDLVQSVVANFIKNQSGQFFNHPSIFEIKKLKKFCAIFIDDSIGSGDRSAEYAIKFFSQKTIRSRWSFGNIRIKILSYSRFQDSECVILNAIPGSNHHCRKHPKDSKITFLSQYCFNSNNLAQRWGKYSEQIINTCNSVKVIPNCRRKGYKGTMASIVFYHSIPNNIPGPLWFENEYWKPLFPRRVFPEWTTTLLETSADQLSFVYRKELSLSPQLIQVLQCYKRGIRKKSSVVFVTGLDNAVIQSVTTRLYSAGLITDKCSLSKAGQEFIRQQKELNSSAIYDHSLYIPTKWCAGRAIVQPSGSGNGVQTESNGSSLFEDGDIGQISLEKTDAKAALPPSSVSISPPSSARADGDASGTIGLKEK
ncbi:MAG: hypothetical protein HGB00_06760 [Chlorobiaceae bacterium]|nr:hypothetical protein [Chlorobiaceae bacterium]